MAEELRLWRIGKNENLEEIPRTQLDLESRIESWISADISIIDPNLLIIGRQVQTDFGGKIDLLCIDSSANLVIVELKRDLTPKEVTAQALDYASWIRDLSLDRIAEIANNHLGSGGPLEDAFLRKFNEDLPEIVNENHSMIIVASDIDASTERIIKYLSDAHGVGINAVHFKYYKVSDKEELLARLFLIEPETIESQVRSKGSSKRRRNASFEELQRVADENGVGELYKDLTTSLESIFNKKTRANQIAFKADIEGSNKVVFSLLPPKSSGETGLCYQLFAYRLSKVAGIPVETIPDYLPQGSKPWVYYPNAGNDYSGYVGFFKTSTEIAKFIKALRNADR